MVPAEATIYLPVIYFGHGDPAELPCHWRKGKEGMYRHTQVGYVIIAAFGLTMLFVVYATDLYGFHWAPVLVLLVLAICLVLFCTLTVEIGREFLSLRFGPGLIRKRFALREIESCRMVRNSWQYG